MPPGMYQCGDWAAGELAEASETPHGRRPAKQWSGDCGVSGRWRQSTPCQVQGLEKLNIWAKRKKNHNGSNAILWASLTASNGTADIRKQMNDVIRLGTRV